MTHWITEKLGTAAYGAADIPADARVVDVRDMVDTAGNTVGLVRDKVDEVVSALSFGETVVVCCDYGISRSNSIAAGALARSEGLTFDAAVRLVMDRIGEPRLNVAVMAVVRRALSEGKGRQPTAHERPVLVTGASGAVGKHLVPRLRASHAIVAPSRAELELSEGAAALDLLINGSGASTVVHLANPRVFSTINAMGETLVMLKNVLTACAQNDARLIYLSGWEVYSGYRSQQLVANESLARRPGSTCGETKALCEALIEHTQDMQPLSVAMLRSSPVYGTGEKPKFIYNFIAKALAGDDIYAHRYRNGFPCLDLLHIDDLVSAVVMALEHDFSGVANLGGGAAISTTAVAQLVVKQLRSDSAVRHRDIASDAPNIVMDYAHATESLGWAPTIAPEVGLARLVADHVAGRDEELEQP